LLEESTLIETEVPFHSAALSIADRHQLPQQSVEEVLPLRHYAWLLRRGIWKIVVAVLVSTALALLYCVSVTPVYEATSRITIDPRLPSAVVGQDSEPADASDVDQVINTEMQIVQSDAVLRPVAEQFKLLATNGGADAGSVRPPYHARFRSAIEALKRFARHDTAQEAAADAPIVLSDLIVTHPPNSLLIDISYRSADPHKAALVANAVAQSYITFTMETRAQSSMVLSAFMEKQIDELKRNMDDSSLALAGYEQKLGVINPDEKTSILAAHILQLQNESTEAQNDRILKETEYRALQGSTPTSSSAAALDISQQSAQLMQQEGLMREAEEKLAVARTTYGPNYPEYKRAANDLAAVTTQYQQMRSEASNRIQVAYQEALNREALLRESLAAAKNESDRLNATSAQYEELKREAEANRNLYDELFRRIKEAGVNAGFQGSSIRFANEARPPLLPVLPERRMIISAAFVISLLGSLLVLVVTDMIDNTLRDPEQARRLTGYNVMGILPRVKCFPARRQTVALECAGDNRTPEPPPNRRGSLNRNFLESQDLYCESISILLRSILQNRPAPRSLLITSAGPGDGKSSCAAHLALAHANLGKRTLLIDADLRIPYQHTFFHLSNDTGLAKSIASNLPLESIRQRVDGFPLFDVVVAGPSMRRYFTHVGDRVAELLQQAANEYDLVIIDSPPVVGLSEPVDIACAADGVLIVGHATRTTRQAIAEVDATLRRVHANVIGVVLNHVRLDMTQCYSHYSTYASDSGRLAS
jgi:succinoglycan biosynthesis transport protein ExoP